MILILAVDKGEEIEATIELSMCVNIKDFNAAYTELRIPELIQVIVAIGTLALSVRISVVAINTEPLSR